MLGGSSNKPGEASNARTNRLKPSSLHPISVDDALRGAMEVNPPDEGKPKDNPKKKRKTKKKAAKRR